MIANESPNADLVDALRRYRSGYPIDNDVRPSTDNADEPLDLDLDAGFYPGSDASPEGEAASSI